MRTEIVLAAVFLLGLLAGVIIHIWGRHRAVKSERPFIKSSTGTPVMETEAGKLFASVGLANQCPDCKSHGFYEGPSGGMSTNIFCTNRECRSGFNLTRFTSTQGTCERISQASIDRYPKEKNIA